MQPDNAVKDVVKAVAAVVGLLSNLTDGVSLKDILGIISVAKEVSVPLQEAALVAEQFLGLDDAARADVIAAIEAEVLFPANANVQEGIQAALEAAVSLSKMIQIFKK